jgi:general secretion pathway protein A
METPYLQHYSLLDKPYSISPNPRFLYISPTHRLALEKTKWSVSDKEGLIIIFGRVGMGKSILARELAMQLKEMPDVNYVFIANPDFPTPNQLLRAIMQEFGVPQTSKSYLELQNIFKNFLREQTQTHKKTLVLLIDEAQSLKSPLVELLRRLMNFESNDQKFLQIVLFAQEEFRKRLAHPRYRNFVNRAPLSSTIEPLSLSETEALLRHRWWVASNGKDNFPFMPEAIEQIYRYSRGEPRLQVILAQNALLGSFLLGTKSIDANIIHEVVKDRGLPDTNPEPEPRSIERHIKKGEKGGKKSS